MFHSTLLLFYFMCRNPKEKMKEEKTNIELGSLKMSLVLPSSIKCSNAAIRGMWLNFDHMSDYCYSMIQTYENSDKKKLTLRQTTKREWKKRKELLQKALVQIFNEKPDDSEEQNQPRVIDVDRMYTEYEDGLNATQREKMGPASLNLDEFEVNLRSHRITGGIFQIEYFEQPLQDVKSDECALLRSRNSILLLNCASLIIQLQSLVASFSHSSRRIEEEAFPLLLLSTPTSKAGAEANARGGRSGN